MLKKENLREYVIMTLALFFTSLGVYFFMIPSGIVVGSISGLAMVLAQLSGLSISVITMILNVGLLIIGFIFIGKEFGVKTVYTSLLFPVFLGFYEAVFPLNGSLTGNNVYDLICNVLLVGFGQALLFNVNASSGGLDIVAKIVSKYTHMEIGKAVTMAGMITAMSSLLVYNIGTFIVSVLGTYANGLVVDYFIGGSIRKRKSVLYLMSRENSKIYS